jgi:hypothetical protein
MFNIKIVNEPRELMKKKRVTITISDPLLSILEKAESNMKSINPKAKISDYIVACLEASHEEESEVSSSQISLDELSEIVKEEAQATAKEARLADIREDINTARSKYLKAASLELEALSYRTTSDDREVLSSVLVILSNIKLALKYKRLPTV